MTAPATKKRAAGLRTGIDYHALTEDAVSGLNRDLIDETLRGEHGDKAKDAFRGVYAQLIEQALKGAFGPWVERSFKAAYAKRLQEELRGVVRTVLQRIADEGLAGQQHVYITFSTRHPDVRLSDSLLARYPNDMTIVLQYEYRDLDVGADDFAVTLSFGGVPQRIEVPFAAITVFADPSVEFGLQFTVDETPEAPEGPERAPASEEPVAQLPQGGAEPPPEGGAEVVTLDRFRKK